jgi:hypothetical protein
MMPVMDLRDPTGVPQSQFMGWIKQNGRDALAIYCRDCNRGIAIFPEARVFADFKKRVSLEIFQNTLLFRLWGEWITTIAGFPRCPHVYPPPDEMKIGPVMWMFDLGPRLN